LVGGISLLQPAVPMAVGKPRNERDKCLTH
jgi:hypothetical protein